MSSFTPWLSATIFGFVYVTATFFLFLWIAGINDLRLLSDSREFAPYLAILVVSLSYVVGVATHFVSDYIWVNYFRTEDAKSGADLKRIREEKRKDLLEELGRRYDTLVLLRHLFLGFLLLLITISGWLISNHLGPLRYAVGFVCVCLFATLLFFFAWRFQRPSYIDFRDEVIPK